MPEEALDDPVPAGGGEPRHHLRAEKPTIKILLYTDAPNRFKLEFDTDYSLAPMIQHLMGHAPAFADLCINWVSRYPTAGSEGKKINVALEEDICKAKKPFDEIWFFGLHKVRKEKFSLGLDPGGPDSDLDDEEVSALTNWMSAEGKPGGGVLMMGDHSAKLFSERLSNKKSTLCPDVPTSEQLFGLGRALGRCVPRARRLRVWEGGPTTDPPNSHNTLQNQGSQGDPHPQRLYLKWFNEKGEPSSGGQPHPLFLYRPGSLIEVFPDHKHEGKVVTPEIAPNDKEWPCGNYLRPLPRVVARGINRTDCELIDIVAAYDGDSADVGRIVADSTWHHYVSMNLFSLGPPAPPDSPADKIGQYYGNLAVWLAARATRREMAHAMFWWLANHPMLLEEVGADRLAIGQMAYSILSAEASPCEIHELLLAVVPDYIRTRFETLYFPEKGFAVSELPSKEVILGCVIDAYQREIINAENSDGPPAEPRTIEQVIDAEFNAAFEMHARQLAHAESAARKHCQPQA